MLLRILGVLEVSKPSPQDWLIREGESNNVSADYSLNLIYKIQGPPLTDRVFLFFGQFS